MTEAGVPDYVVQSYFGIVAPAGSPQPILDKLNAQIRAALKTPKFEGILQKFDAAPNDETAQQFQSFALQEAKRWKGIADATGIKLDYCDPPSRPRANSANLFRNGWSAATFLLHES
jgi:tripartite-type tricarboxylate transporter receptor subunit TctC